MENNINPNDFKYLGITNEFRLFAEANQLVNQSKENDCDMNLNQAVEICIVKDFIFKILNESDDCSLPHIYSAMAKNLKIRLKEVDIHIPGRNNITAECIYLPCSLYDYSILNQFDLFPEGTYEDNDMFKNALLLGIHEHNGDEPFLQLLIQRRRL